MNSNRKTARILEDVKINVKIKLSALWVTVMVLFAYGDIKSFFRPGIIEVILAGEIAGFEINQVFLLLTAISVVIPIIMIFLSLVLKPKVNRWANIIVGLDQWCVGRRGYVRRADCQSVRSGSDRRLQHEERGHGPIDRRRPCH